MPSWKIVFYVRSLCAFLSIICWGCLKFIIRKVTRLTELQRIVYGEVKGARRIILVERSLYNSRNPVLIEQLEELEDAFNGLKDSNVELRDQRRSLCNKSAILIAKAKGISLKPHWPFIKALQECLEIIFTYKYMVKMIIARRNTLFDKDNDTHEDKLLKIWRNFCPNETLSGRKTKQWQALGFQGDDPATDFRGGGVLSLESILYLSQEHPEVAHRLLISANHELRGYPLALNIIQMVFLGSEICLEGTAKTHFYNKLSSNLHLDEDCLLKKRIWKEELISVFHDFVVALTSDFDGFWIDSKPQNIMDHCWIKKSFDKKIIKRLQDHQCCFLMDVRTV